MLLLLLFNWCGYHWVINVMQRKADLQLEAKLDKNEYIESQLIVISVPINLPYQTDWVSFERCDGEIEVNGLHYKYVKRKIENGNLILKCIPNDAKERLEAAKNDIFKINNDLEQDIGVGKSHVPNSGTKKYSALDYLIPRHVDFAAENMTLEVQPFNLYLPRAVSALYFSTPAQPPELSSFSTPQWL